MRPTNHILVLLLLQGICHFADAEIPPTRRFLVSGQGSGRCPDPVSTSGSRRDIRARSNIDCARQCTSSINCLHYAFKRNTGRCALYTTTPVSVTYDEDCFLMLVGYPVYIRLRNYCFLIPVTCLVFIQHASYDRLYCLVNQFAIY